MSAPTYLLHLFAVRPRLSTEVSKLPLTITFIPLTLCCQSDPVTACYVDAGLGVLLAVPGNIDHQRSSQGESYNSIILYTNCRLFTQVSSPCVVLFPQPSTIDTRYKKHSDNTIIMVQPHIQVQNFEFRHRITQNILYKGESLYFSHKLSFLPWFRRPVSCWVPIG